MMSAVSPSAIAVGENCLGSFHGFWLLFAKPKSDIKIPFYPKTPLQPNRIKPLQFRKSAVEINSGVVETLQGSVEIQPCPVEIKPDALETLLGSVEIQPCPVEIKPDVVETLHRSVEILPDVVEAKQELVEIQP